MPVTIKVNGASHSLAHKMAGGLSTATIPDVCKTPSPGGPVPLPYPNIAQIITLSNGTTTVKSDKIMAAIKGSEFSISNGDQAGTVGGVKSNVFMKEATWILYSFDVKLNGKNACRLTDKMFHNHENAANLAGYIGPVVLVGEAKEVADNLCIEFCEELKKGHTKGKRGGWRKKKSFSRRHNWSKNLEKKIDAQKIAGDPRWANLKITPSFQGGATIPDAVFYVADKAFRVFDFKFPKDRMRGDQFERQFEVCNKKPVEINAKDCGC